MNLKKFRERIKQSFKFISGVQRGAATDIIEVELVELENIFALLLFGCFVGLPTPPVHLTLKLLPVMQDELMIVFNRVSVAKGPLSELFSVLDIG
jgi:hypothetical protein